MLFDFQSLLDDPEPKSLAYTEKPQSQIENILLGIDFKLDELCAKSRAPSTDPS